MRDASSLLGAWVRRFLMEHLVSERNLSRNTQRSYRDTLRLLLPVIARRARKPVDRLMVTDLSADCLRQFLSELEEKRGCATTLPEFHGQFWVPCYCSPRSLAAHRQLRPHARCQPPVTVSSGVIRVSALVDHVA